MMVGIDPGHSGPIEPGAVGGQGTKECDVTLAVGRLVQRLLSDQHRVMLTRDGNVDDDLLSWRGRMAQGCDLFISIHCNSAGNRAARGSESWIIENASEASQALALYLCESLAGVTGEDRGVKRANFTVISVAESLGVPSVLAELEFLSNSEGERSLQERQLEFAQAIAGAIINFGQEMGWV